jgi:predicted ATP-dependent serine protease
MNPQFDRTLSVENILKIIDEQNRCEESNDIDITKDKGSIKLNILTFNEYLEKAKMASDLKKLFGDFCHSGEIIIIAGKAGVGKSTLAYTLADSIVQGTDILQQNNENEPLTMLYLDFEMNERHIKKRFPEYKTTSNFFRPDVSQMLLETDGIFNFDIIENCIIETDAKVVIVDNISAISVKTTSDIQSSLDLIKRASLVKNKYDITLIFIAHTPKISEQRALNLYDIAGASSISNMIDSAIIINKSCKDANTRYIKSVKNRSSQEIEKVLVCKIKNEKWLHLEYECWDDEKNHLPVLDTDKSAKKIENLREICMTMFEEKFEYQYNEFCNEYSNLYFPKTFYNGKKLIQKLLNENLIIKNPDNKYILNANEFQ